MIFYISSCMGCFLFHVVLALLLLLVIVVLLCMCDIFFMLGCSTGSYEPMQAVGGPVVGTALHSLS